MSEHTYEQRIFLGLLAEKRELGLTSRLIWLRIRVMENLRLDVNDLPTPVISFYFELLLGMLMGLASGKINI